MKRLKLAICVILPLILVIAFSGCQAAEPETAQPVSQGEATVEEKPEEQAEPEQAEPPEPVSVAIDSSIPASLGAVITQAAKETFPHSEISDDAQAADISIGLELQDGLESISLVFAPVTGFFNLTDEISFDQLKDFWDKGTSLEMELVITDSNLSLLEAVLGPIHAGQVRVVNEDGLAAALAEGGNFSIVPFDEIKKEYKVLYLDGISVLAKDAPMDNYPLQLGLKLEGEEQFLLPLAEILDGYQLSNRDTDKMLTINMTGVTALVRGTANRMEQNGILYPAEQITDTLLAADITHISNEIPFVEGCTGARDSALVFCSKPEYFELLQHVGTDVVELTGNHMNDYGPQWMEYTLDIYDEAGLPYFGGGRDLEDSYQPALFEIGGNKIAFLGCNYWGPAYDWATEDSPGSTPPNLEDLEAITADLKSQGYNVIFTFQYVETYNYYPTEQQVIDFGRMVDAGASIVSGSQSHHPMGVEFKPEGFINYGLGNIFFDQMRSLGMRQGIIARHVFYENRHIGTELITTMLEDYSQPRLTTAEERQELLASIFEGSIK